MAGLATSITLVGTIGKVPEVVPCTFCRLELQTQQSITFRLDYDLAVCLQGFRKKPTVVLHPLSGTYILSEALDVRYSSCHDKKVPSPLGSGYTTAEVAGLLLL